MPISTQATLLGPTTLDPAVAGLGIGPTYDNWEAGVMFGCVCDWGFYGPDCSQREWAELTVTARAS